MDSLKPLKISKPQRSLRGKVWQSKKLLLFLVPFLIISLFLASSTSPSVFNYVLGRESSLELDRGRLNVLLLGIAGGKHGGPNLTDTIMIASYDIKTSNVDLISLPRDLWLQKHQTKINTLYQIGLEKQEGLDFVRREIGEVLDLSIPYAIRVDFAGFIKAVDIVGGIDVEVVQPFDDYLYPIEGKEDDLCDFEEKEVEVGEEEGKRLNIQPGKVKALFDREGKIATAAAKPGEEIPYDDNAIGKFFPCRFEHLRFDRGLTHMEGATALKFVRSRHGTNKEGTDFARSRRQQRVLGTFKEKVLSLETFTDPRKLVELVQTFEQSVDSNISQGDYLEFAKLLKKVKAIRSLVIDGSGKDPLLVTPKVGIYRAWVLIPPDNNFSRIQKYIQSVFQGQLEASEGGREN